MFYLSLTRYTRAYLAGLTYDYHLAKFNAHNFFGIPLTFMASFPHQSRKAMVFCKLYHPLEYTFYFLSETNEILLFHLSTSQLVFFWLWRHLFHLLSYRLLTLTILHSFFASIELIGINPMNFDLLWISDILFWFDLSENCAQMLLFCYVFHNLELSLLNFWNLSCLSQTLYFLELFH